MVKTKRFYDDVYGVEVRVFVGCSLRDLNKRLGIKSGHRDKLDCAEHFVIQSQRGIERIIWIENPKDYRSLLHEVVHMVERVFREKGIAFKGEPAAYYIDHWTARLTDWMSRKK